MIQILPVYVPGYLVPFLIKEMDGVSSIQNNEHFTNIKIEKNSILGMFLRRNIRPSYKIKNYQMVIYSKKIGPQQAFSIDLLEYQNLVEFRVDLTFKELENFYKFLSHVFTISFYTYVKGYLKARKASGKSYGILMEAIRAIIDEYDLLEYSFSESQLKELYYSYSRNGCCQALHKNIPYPKNFLDTPDIT